MPLSSNKKVEKTHPSQWDPNTMVRVVSSPTPSDITEYRVTEPTLALGVPPWPTSVHIGLTRPSFAILDPLWLISSNHGPP